MTRVTTAQILPATPDEAEELANRAIGDYLNVCRITDSSQVANYLMKLASFVGVTMANAEGCEMAALRLESAAKVIRETMPMEPAILRTVQ